jgi:hypothetical protein
MITSLVRYFEGERGVAVILAAIPLVFVVTIFIRCWFLLRLAKSHKQTRK